MELSHTTDIPPSATLRMNSLALAKKKRGERVFNLAAGEPMLPIHSAVGEAVEKAIADGQTHYGPVPGIAALREAASAWMKDTYSATFTSEQTVVTCGGKHALMLSLQAILNPGDEVLIVAPYWVSYPTMVTLAGGTSKILETREENGWKISPEQITEACTDKTRVLILNNAANPTGALYTREELQAILEAAAAQNLIVISDEVYSGLVYDGATYVSCASFDQFRENTIVVHSASKNFAMTGLRVGFVFGPNDFISRVTALQGQSTSSTSSLSQYAALAAFAHANEIMKKNNTAMQARRDVFVETFQKIFGMTIQVPQSALYAFVSLSSFGVDQTDARAWCLQMLEQRNVAMVPGEPFGASGYVRCSYGVEEDEIREALMALKRHI